ncbi:MAG: aldo/keto reductase [Candidatus Aminicenantes bacterium]|nr:MAG: aldo/keto reductase [Candidatus Aminicenantes bacterium]
MYKKNCIKRRNFLKRSAFGIIGAGMAATAGCVKEPEPPEKQEEEPLLRVKEHRVLGRTGFKVSDIGAGSIQDEGVLGAAFDAGVNYVDTAEQYPGHHKTVGQAIKGRDRKSIFIATKLQVLEDKSKEGFLKRARKCLEEINTEYVDCMMMHMPEKVETLKTEGFHSAMQELKAEGRIRFIGVSNHGSFWFKDPEETMEKVLLAAAEDGRFDVFLMAYNFLQMDQAEKVLEVCKDRKIGAALMKSTPIAIYYSLKSRLEQLEKEEKEIHPLYSSGLERYREKYDRAQDFIKKYNLQNQTEIRDAAVRFVLDNPNVNTVCCLPKTHDELEQFLLLSGTKLKDWDKAKLSAYREGCGELYCRHACGICEPQCPHTVPVNTIMRYNHYFMAQGREKEGMEKYAAIPGAKADKCGSCSGYCETACPYNVPIQGMLLLAHNQLSLAKKLGF